MVPAFIDWPYVLKEDIEKRAVQQVRRKVELISSFFSVVVVFSDGLILSRNGKKKVGTKTGRIHKRFTGMYGRWRNKYIPIRHRLGCDG